ncbi:hypothetical protein F885_02332 [Acinetobacter higginsii]|uniref:Uncharacterized protein n=1 Tax=Acinetobacter higginsii TaxID=70347 RepID=N9RJB3_9GAMM|nr:hypothetical protein F902_02444 [Acinetobacter higginsii]ENX60140.1 hypothetical protein F885_02332 [Acinetobacter higginsii]
MFSFSNHTLNWVELYSTSSLSHQQQDEVLS